MDILYQICYSLYMKQVILIHGLPSEEEVMDETSPSPSNAHWFPWVQKQLTREGIICQSLEMPRSYNPVYKDQERVLNQMEISEETILIGHSCGAGFLIRYFSEHKELKPRRVVLVAPWLNPEKFLETLNPETDYFKFEIDSALTQRTDLQCVYSTDDDDFIIDTVKIIQEKLPDTKMTVFKDKGHFVGPEFRTKGFPELLEFLR